MTFLYIRLRRHEPFEIVAVGLTTDLLKHHRVYRFEEGWFRYVVQFCSTTAAKRAEQMILDICQTDTSGEYLKASELSRNILNTEYSETKEDYMKLAQVLMEKLRESAKGVVRIDAITEPRTDDTHSLTMTNVVTHGFSVNAFGKEQIKHMWDNDSVFRVRDQPSDIKRLAVAIQEIWFNPLMIRNQNVRGDSNQAHLWDGDNWKALPYKVLWDLISDTMNRRVFEIERLRSLRERNIEFRIISAFHRLHNPERCEEIEEVLEECEPRYLALYLSRMETIMSNFIAQLVMAFYHGAEIPSVENLSDPVIEREQWDPHPRV